MIEETKDSGTFHFNDEEFVQTIAYLMQLEDYCKKHSVDSGEELRKHLNLAIEAMMWAYVKLF